MTRRKEGPPSTHRRGHGFEQARAAGAPFVAPRSGRLMNFFVKERAAEEKIRELLQQNPWFRRRAVEIHEESKRISNGKGLAHYIILERIESELAQARKARSKRPPQSN